MRSYQGHKLHNYVKCILGQWNKEIKNKVGIFTLPLTTVQFSLFTAFTATNI